MKPRAKRTWRWVSRDSRSIGGSLSRTVIVHRYIRKPDEHFGFYNDLNDTALVCAQDFQALFGVCPKPGECVKVHFPPGKIIE